MKKKSDFHQKFNSKHRTVANMITEERDNSIKNLTLPEIWLTMGENLDEELLKNVDTLDTSDPGWDRLFYGKSRGKSKWIFENILSRVGKFIKRIISSSNDIFYYYYGPSAFELIIKSCIQVETIIFQEAPLLSEVIQLVKYCENVKEFRMASSFENFDNEFGEFFQNNVRLKYVEMPFNNMKGNCLPYLKSTIIEKLVIKTISIEAVDQLVTVLKELNNLKVLGIEDVSSECKGEKNSLLMKTICECKNLESITMSVNMVSDALSVSESSIQFLTQLKLISNKDVNDSALSILASGLERLHALDVSDCQEITDDGLMQISKLPDIKELNISKLKISGTCLQKFTTLEYLYCSESFVFDTGLCHVIVNCKNLRYLNVKNCRNVTLMTVETIFEVISQRRNDITLKLMLDYELAVSTDSKTTSLLKLHCEKSRTTGSDFVSSEFYCPTKVKEIRNSSFLRTLLKLKSAEINETLPYLNVHCLINILIFVPVKSRIVLERVSSNFRDLIKESWKRVRKLDLSTEDWAILFFYETQQRINPILIKVLSKMGKYLTSIGLRRRCSLKIIKERCPKLNRIDIHFIGIKLIELNKLLKDCQYLSMSIPYKANAEECIFQRNHPLKSLRFHAPNYQCYHIRNLNPISLERLEIFEHPEFFGDVFSKILSGFTNLRYLSLVQCNIHLSMIQAIASCRNLNVLALQLYPGGDFIDLQPLLGLKNLEKLAILDYQLDDEFLQRMTESWTRLRYIDLTGCDSITDEGLQGFGNLKNLNTLIINNVNKIFGSGLSTLNQDSLRRLEFEGCRSMTYESLDNVLNNCRQLEFLNIVGCERMDKMILITAVKITEERVNNLLLKLIIDRELIENEEMEIPPLLRLLIVDK